MVVLPHSELKNSMKFPCSIAYLFLKSHRAVQTSTNFINFLKVIFWTQNVLIPPYLTPNFTHSYLLLYYFWEILPYSNKYQLLQPSTTFYQILLLLRTNFYITLTNFYHFPLVPPFTNFYYLPPTFINFYTTFSTSQQFCDTNFSSKNVCN